MPFGTPYVVTKPFHATNFGNEIFGILAMTHEEMREGTAPDYTKSAGEVLWDAMIYILLCR